MTRAHASHDLFEQHDHLFEQIAAYVGPTSVDGVALPPRAYWDQDLFERERVQIFHRSWYCVGRVESFAKPGDYLALTIAGEPLVVIRGGDGELRALSNVCRHRLYPLVADGSGSVTRLTCPYHLWTYRLDGQLAGAPCMSDASGFDSAACRLPSFRVDEWLGFVFVNLDANAESLQVQFAGAEAPFRNHDMGDSIGIAHYHKVWAGNWKFAVENGSESYHHMGLHAKTVEPYMPGRGTFVVETHDRWAQHRTPILPDVGAQYGVRLDYPTRLTPDDRVAMKGVTVFPSFVVLSVGDLVNWLSWIPLDVDHTDVWSGLLLPPAALAVEPNQDRLRVNAQRSLELINGEDEHATALLQRAAASKHATRGCLSAKEGVLGAFHRYLARELVRD